MSKIRVLIADDHAVVRDGLAAMIGRWPDTTVVAEAQDGRRLGFDGKSLIHPNQIATSNAVFAPSAEEVTQARKIIAAFDAPENAGKGVIALDGRMVERLHAAMARRTVAIAEAIAARQQPA